MKYLNNLFWEAPPNQPENRLFWPEFHLSYSQISQKPLGGWVSKQIWENFHKKERFCFWGAPLREGVKRKKMYFLEKFSQICEPTHPPQGFCEIWENGRWNSDRKRRFFGWFGGVWGVWTLFWNQPLKTTHIWERSSKIVGAGGSPKRN